LGVLLLSLCVCSNDVFINTVTDLFASYGRTRRLFNAVRRIKSNVSTKMEIFDLFVASLQIQAQPQTVTLTQTATSAPAQVQMIPAGTATAQVVQQKIIQQQVVTAAASPQIQTPPPHSPAQQPSAAESPVQQPTQTQQPNKSQARQGGIRAKAPAKPSGGNS